MSKRQTLMLLGLATIILPFLGLPLSWKETATVIIGVLIVLIAYRIRPAPRPPDEPDSMPYAEHRNEPPAASAPAAGPDVIHNGIPPGVMTRARRRNGAARMAGSCALGVCVIALAAYVSPYILPADRIAYSAQTMAAIAATTTPPVPPAFVATHIPTPDPLRGIYMTACTASVPALRDKVVALFGETDLNAVVIDIKDYSGTISYASTTLQARGAAPGCRIDDLPQFIGELHAKGIYVIGRITTFQDSYYATAHPDVAILSKADPSKVWRDPAGLAYIDPGAKPYWDYIVAIAEEAHSIGFDEINFDYIRFPSDGDLADMTSLWDASSTKAETIDSFFAYLHGKLSAAGITSSADLFGQTTSAPGDMGIGQVLVNALPYFDYVAPMVYPSHFANGFLGFANPAEHPYEVVKYSMTSGVERAVAASSSPLELRPWLQDFDLGAVYTPDMVHQQIQATYDSGLNSWILWNAASKYDPADVDMSETGDATSTP